MRSNLKIAVVLAASVLTGMTAQAQQVVITQYYEGTSVNKWIELKNIGASAVDFTTGGWTLGHWNNANAEGYKTNIAPSFSVSLAALGTVAAGGVVLLNNSGATLPAYAVANMSNNSVINFNGNDSIVLYADPGTGFATANIVDAIGFTNGGNEGANLSFVRASTAAGWNTTAGSNATTFPAVWTSYTNAQVDGAASGDPQYLGQSTLPVELMLFQVE